MIDNWVKCDSIFSIYYIGKSQNGIEIVINESEGEGDEKIDYSDYSIRAQIGSCNLGEYFVDRRIKTLFEHVQKMHNESARKYLSAYLSEEQA